MKTKIVLWGENASNEKILVALELLEKDNKVLLHTFPQEIASEEFNRSLLEDWRENKEVPFPEGFTTQERPLSVSESLLPDDIKVERTDVISRAQVEWHFVVLSSKLYEMYKDEIDEFKEKVNGMSEFSDGVWNDMKTFWSKVQSQVNEKNLFREHAGVLKERTNNLFDKLKELRKVAQKDFEAKSSEIAATFKSELADIEEKIDKGLGLKPLFEDLKALQKKLYGQKLTKGDRTSIFDQLDAAFKKIKEKRFGEGKGQQAAQGGNSALGRLQSRYNGLMNAINKMERSIKRDKDDMSFQDRKINQTDGQLELQIRQAKQKMIEERINSKSAKLADMNKTKVELEKRMEQEKKKAEDRKIQAEMEAKRKEAAAAVKEKIASEIKEKEEELKDKSETLEKAAKDIIEAKKPKVKKVVEPVSLAGASDEDVDTKTTTDEKTESKADNQEPESILESVMEKVEDFVEDAMDTVNAVAEVIEDKVEDAIEKFTSEEE